MRPIYVSQRSVMLPLDTEYFSFLLCWIWLILFAVNVCISIHSFNQNQMWRKYQTQKLLIIESFGLACILSAVNMNCHCLLLCNPMPVAISVGVVRHDFVVCVRLFGNHVWICVSRTRLLVVDARSGHMYHWYVRLVNSKRIPYAVHWSEIDPAPFIGGWFGLPPFFLY